MSGTSFSIEVARSFQLTSRRVTASVAGFDPRSFYVERFWLPILGPSTTWLVRHLVWRLESSGEGVEINAVETALALGLGGRPGRHAPFHRAIRRAADFDLILLGPSRAASNVTGSDPYPLVVRRRLPLLPERLEQRLSPELAAEHARSAKGAPKEADGVGRVRRLARTLADLGESEEEVRAQLIAWHIEPELASTCARVAASRLTPENITPPAARRVAVGATRAVVGR